MNKRIKKKKQKSEILCAVANDRKKVKNNTTKLNIMVPPLKKKIIKPIPKTDIPVDKETIIPDEFVRRRLWNE